ncbi:rop guanine nucleotide exchange factor 14 isoform X1 [Cinnamomum micranthum f. kanehirae]|uniref:Rop guanine nucleotide exchange factor 14 isoform X1 n=1 Tax=Cinnamomum micranthum f. kanehirae TaxID=337451 RepID=A0A3S3NCT3_9MAGN|nr:rop guanine nucleotide exchange factor 14 isoform X1 [Cinnamomum micranthum f. kanehirae]
MKRLTCCRREKEMSVDFDEQERIMKYNGLESCIINSYSYDNESRTSMVDGCPTDSMDEDASSSSSSKDAFGSFSSQWLMNKSEEYCPTKCEIGKSPNHFSDKEKPAYTIQFSDVETMKERFAKLLLGEDISGGCKGHSTALALSKAITNLAASVFGELWKLEPLPAERKSKWRREMDWFLSPANFMVELVPAKQSGANGRTLEIMTPKTRSDIHMNLPALRKLDSMLIETLDSMVNMEFWYAEGGSRAEGRGRSARHGMKWWLPSPRVPISGLSAAERKKLCFQGKFVQQILKAAKSINQNVLLEMPVPVIRDAIPKSARASLGDDLYRAITMELRSVEEILHLLNLENEHDILETENRLEAATYAWKQRISNQVNGKSPARNSWPFVRELELDKIEAWCERAEALLQLLKIKNPSLPQTFLDATKVQYNKDVGHSILEAYSRVLGSLAFRILSRLVDILQEDDLYKPDSPVTAFKFDCFSNIIIPRTPDTLARNIRHSLIDQMNSVDGCFCSSRVSKASDEFSDSEARTSSTTATPCRSSRAWCYGREVCRSFSPSTSP